MVGTWTYNTTWNYIQVTGGTLIAPCAFEDAWNADKAGSLQLMPPTPAALNLDLTTQVKPADDKALKLNLIITGFLGVGTVTLTGLDKDDVAQTEDIVIVGAGTYVSTKWYKSIDADGVDCIGLYTIEITQGQWGVVWKTGTNQYALSCKLLVGDGFTTTYFTDTKKQVTFLSGCLGGNGQALIEVLDYAYLTFGTLISESLKTTKDGIQLYDEETSYTLTPVIQGCVASTHGQINLFSSSFEGDSADIRHYITSLGTPTKMWNCQGTGIIVSTQTNLNLFNYLGTKGFYGLLFGSAGGTYDRITIMGAGAETFYLYHEFAITFTNGYSRGSTGIALAAAITADCYLVNVDSDTWAITWNGVCTAKVYRQYTFDLVTETNATVTLHDKNGIQIFSVTADAVTGAITQQTVSRGYYDQANGNTLQDYSPHTLTITKEGKQTYAWEGYIDEKIDWRITLLEPIGGIPIHYLKEQEENEELLEASLMANAAFISRELEES